MARQEKEKRLDKGFAEYLKRKVASEAWKRQKEVDEKYCTEH